MTSDDSLNDVPHVHAISELKGVGAFFLKDTVATPRRRLVFWSSPYSSLKYAASLSSEGEE